MLACEDYPALADRQLAKIGAEFPEWLGKHYSDHKLYKNSFVISDAYGGGVIGFRNLDDPSKYMSAEFAIIAVDELTKNPYSLFIELKTRLRWPGLTDFECPFVAGTNPGGIGHGWVKQLWIDRDFPEEFYINPGKVDYRPYFHYIQSLADDNPYLDESYWRGLETLPIAERRAYRYGEWDFPLGQAFPELTKEAHGYDPGEIKVPENTWLLMTYDWGFGKPFSIGWWFTDADGRLYRFAEWYGWNGTADQGLRLSDTDVGVGIREREERMGIWGRPIARRAGPDCFNKKPDPRGGGQGPSTAEVLRHQGIILTPGDPRRNLKIRQFRERLRKPKEGFPMMRIALRGCEQFWRTVPGLITADPPIKRTSTQMEKITFMMKPVMRQWRDHLACSH